MPISTKIVLPVNKGDKVRLLFDFIGIDEAREHIATVTKVTHRYGRVNDGRDKVNALITYTPVQMGRTMSSDSCDAVFVEEVLERAPTPARPENVYREAKDARVVKARRVSGYLVGDLGSCIGFCLAKLDIRLTTAIHPIRARNLFFQSRRGCIASGMPTKMFGEGTIIVREKPFSKWVKDNATRLVYHSDELDAEETESNKRYEAEYHVMYEAERD